MNKDEGIPQEEFIMRLDKWLKVARFFKKREDAAEAVESGSVKVNQERVKPAKNIKAGDTLTIRKNGQYRNYVIKKLTTRSLSGELAKTLYEIELPAGMTGDKTEFMKILEEQDKLAKKEKRVKPNKKERREINNFKYGD